ncbi:phenylalanyl-tRNA synthetase, alpha subunit [Bernardetia litoralis DSM 6794]|uniref:Phenylalanine--tRNA ligase alpha subunit n=1 Tax=Bernardetia litoralis (strain ATCC 23117 / DSM 6794 / NBRC 15988 / NCIMB 1366 / Fx l1 / Sio-4) TaxID=880071 RepID=I4AKA8_BERLS|nr:phenylalanine--tRNA ligase subunit alpha [Bernardetia litoralis]AFM04393.1 phenylalanyl-tRNA synthetase, alpha subunit [Bernardetia litoralis DSM 6794]
MLQEKVNLLLSEVEKFEIQSTEQLENFRLDFISRNSKLSTLFDEFKTVPKEQKRTLGQQINVLKQAAEAKFRTKKQEIEDAQDATQGTDLDITLPSSYETLGSLHPVSQVRDEIIQIFERIGFNLSEGPEIELDWYNFTALNFPENHPAREMQDTFFIEKDPDILLRTHTSPVQVRVMKNQKPPIRTLSVGRVFRNETISARSHCMFHQIEGLYVNEGVSFAQLKQTLLYFAKEFFGQHAKIRLRPSYFPFTEPSAEVDVYLGTKTESDYRLTKGTGWLEILGCGMVHPNVLENVNIDSKKYNGFAFGMGIERIALLRYDIPDIRMLFENEMRFLRQF